MIRAALITELGAGAICGEISEDPTGDGESTVTMEAATLNPVDLAIAGGSFHAGHPQLPYVPGIEAVGSVEGRRVYVSGAGLGITRNGLIRDSFAADDKIFIDIPEKADAATAAALGTAGLAGWLPISWRAKVQRGETVLVLGATGFAGNIAVQAAKHLGAGRVVAAGRNHDRLTALDGVADAVVPLDTPDLGAAFVAACGEEGAHVIYDCLWGTPLEAALQAAAVGARVVQVGASAGQTGVIPSAAVRGKRLDLLGYSNFGVPRETLASAYLEIVTLAIEGELRVHIERVPLEQVADAWSGLGRGGTKYVVIP